MVEVSELIENCSNKVLDPNTATEDRSREVDNICKLKKVEYEHDRDIKAQTANEKKMADEANDRSKQMKAERNRFIVSTGLKTAGVLLYFGVYAAVSYLGVGIELNDSHWIPTVKENIKSLKLKNPVK